MGPQGKPNHVTSILAEKEEKIEQLEVLIQAYRARISHLQTRLLSTSDLLNELRSSHTRELSSETQAKERLSDKLDRYIDVVKVAEIERDDLRDAVLQLVEKVELSNDYSLWPHSRIQITSLADPMTIQQEAQQNANGSDKDLLRYVSAMIASLRLERDAEKKAHKETRQRTTARIVALEAQLACREAELESCVAHTECFALEDLGHMGRADVPELPMMTHDEVVRALDVRSAKNKGLELEHEILVMKLEQARSLAHQSGPLRRTEDNEQRAPAAATSSNFRSLHSEISAPPSSPPRATHPAHVSAPRSPPGSLSLESSLEDVDITIRAASPPARPHRLLPIEDLSRQIKYLASKIDAFKAERDLHSQVIAAEHLSSESSSPGTVFERILLMEEECARLRVSEQTLMADLEKSNKAALAREKELMEEIRKLQHLLQGRHVQTTDVPPLLEAFDGEMSMELATPLRPTSLLPTSRSPSQSRPPSTSVRNSPRSAYVDPPSIPLPLSPIQLSPQSPASRSPLPPTAKSPPILSQPSPRRSSPSTGVSELQRLEKELAAARRQLEQGENVVSEWREVLEGMQFRDG